ncbi:MAG: conjugal transfer protein TraN [Thermodesulfobacteriota bacterium]
MIKKIVRFFVCGVLGCFVFGTTVAADGLIPATGCFKDFNGNGLLDSGEFGECVTTPEGHLCLLDHIPCVNRETAANCPGPSSLNSASDQCEYPIQYRCSSSGSLYSSEETCRSGCAPGSECESHCPSGMTIQSVICRADPACASGVYDGATDTCRYSTCPYGDAYFCQEMSGTNYCSAQTCLDPSEHITHPGTSEGEGDLTDNGSRDSENRCLGKIYIFSGRDRRCRTWGASISFDDCCKSKEYLWGLLECNDSEKELAGLKGEGLCHYVGQYCSQELHLLLGDVCVEESKSYCCFNSKLARIVQEQGRRQLSTLSGWGDPSSPNCRGFTPEEFQVLDFSLIDLSEWHGHIRTKPQRQIENNLRQGVTDFYRDHGN